MLFYKTKQKLQSWVKQIIGEKNYKNCFHEPKQIYDYDYTIRSLETRKKYVSLYEKHIRYIYSDSEAINKIKVIIKKKTIEREHKSNAFNYLYRNRNKNFLKLQQKTSDTDWNLNLFNKKRLYTPYIYT